MIRQMMLVGLLGLCASCGSFRQPQSAGAGDGGSANHYVDRGSLARTFLIRHQGRQGTAFTIEVDGLQYMVTAKHVVDGIGQRDPLEILRGAEWRTCDLKAVWYPPSGGDIALLSPVHALSAVHPQTTDPETAYYISQRAFFLGFPHGLNIDVGDENNGYPLPFVKTGFVSGVGAIGYGDQVIYLDGHNNPGFSGGPVVVMSGTNTPAVIGVVSGYVLETQPIVRHDVTTELLSNANSGLVVAYSLSSALQHAASARTGAAIGG